jgi:hypothetical protein
MQPNRQQPTPPKPYLFVVNPETTKLYDMALLPMEDFVFCFRKQFMFQRGKGGMRVGKYYPIKSGALGLKTDKWVILVFMYVGEICGFTDDEMRKELGIKASLYEVLKKELPNITSGKYPDKMLYKIISNKSKLVRNSLFNTYRLKITIPLL